MKEERRLRKKARRTSHSKDNWPVKTCLMCGADYRAIDKRQRYCSNECYVRHRPDMGHGRGGVRPDLGHFCRSRWEANVCRILRSFGIEYVFEPRYFQLPSGKYLPDIQVGETFIEVKGWMKSASRKKLDEFSVDHHLVLVDTEKYRALTRAFAHLIPNWEYDLYGP